MSPKNNKEAIEHINEILKNMKLKKPISQKKIGILYSILENDFDENLDKIENILLNEYNNSNKNGKINSLQDLLNKNIGEKYGD